MNKYQKALIKLRTLERQSNFERCLDIAPQIQCDILQELVDLVEDEKTLEILIELKRQKHSCTENKIVGYGFYTQRTGAKSTITEVIIETKVV